LKRDPVSQHCKHRSVPLIWDQSRYTSVGADSAWEEQARFGLKTGIALGLHLPERRHLFIGVDRRQALPAEGNAVSRLVANLQLFAVCARESMTSAMTPVEDLPVALAPRELECLRWTMEGKTAWEVGAIVGLAELTVVSYLRNAMRKLGCVSKHQAVVRALRLGLIR
jgi:DNA-binding CsgD family transcriptional regulator